MYPMCVFSLVAKTEKGSQLGGKSKTKLNSDQVAYGLTVNALLEKEAIVLDTKRKSVALVR